MIKKYKTALAALAATLMIAGCTAGKTEKPAAAKKEMTVTSSGIKNGIIEDKYGKRGTEFNANGVPAYSLPLKIENAPEGTVSYALVMEDKDAFPVSGGFSWIHWTAANITRTELKEDESRTARDFVQGVNSWISVQGGSQSEELSSRYGGMYPPDEQFPHEYPEHIYEIHVYALDKMLDLKQGFRLNELFRQMEGHILAEYTLKGSYAK